MSMMDDIEKLQHENAELREAFKALEGLLNRLGQMAAATAARAHAINRMLVIKGVCTAEELSALEMRSMLELSGQLPEQVPQVIDPTPKEIVKPN